MKHLARLAFIAAACLATGMAPAQSPDPSAERAFWDSVKDSKNPDELKAYLETFPNGLFAPLARARLGAVPQAAAPAGGAPGPAERMRGRWKSIVDGALYDIEPDGRSFKIYFASQRRYLKFDGTLNGRTVSGNGHFDPALCEGQSQAVCGPSGGYGFMGELAPNGSALQLLMRHTNPAAVDLLKKAINGFKETLVREAGP